MCCVLLGSRLEEEGKSSFLLLLLLLLFSSPLPNQQRRTLNKLSPGLRRRNFCRQAPTEHANRRPSVRKRVPNVCTCFDRASALHATVAGWVLLLGFQIVTSIPCTLIVLETTIVKNCQCQSFPCHHPLAEFDSVRGKWRILLGEGEASSTPPLPPYSNPPLCPPIKSSSPSPFFHIHLYSSPLLLLLLLSSSIVQQSPSIW